MQYYTMPYIMEVIHFLTLVQNNLREETVGVSLDENEQYVLFKVKVTHGSRKKTLSDG